MKSDNLRVQKRALMDSTTWRKVMLSLRDIIDMCDCTEEEIEAIAMHEHLPDAVATEYAEYLVHCDDGVPRIRKIIIEDIEFAKKDGNEAQVEKLNTVLKHFVANHPEYNGLVTE